MQALDALDVDSFWQPDHPSLAADCWLTLGAVATHTRRLRLGPLVSCVGYRPPALLARHAADVDRLSGGRLILGLGAGWVEGEYRALGLPFPALRDRLRGLEETVEVVPGLWATDARFSQAPVAGAEQVAPMIWARRPFTYHGRDARFDRAALGPAPVQTPRVPILIGGSGERVTFRLVARYADMANIEESKAPTAAAVGAKLQALRRRDEVRRPFDTLLPSYFVNRVVLAATPARLQAKLPGLGLRGASANAGTPGELVARLRPIVAAGMRYLIANLAAYDDLETAQLLAEQVLPQLRAE